MDKIIHKGIVEKINQNSILIRLSDIDGCSTCSLKSSCESNGLKKDIFELKLSDSDFKIGQKVELILTKRQALMSLLQAYIFPLILMVVSVIIFSIFYNDLISGLLSLLVLSLYFLILFFTKKYSDKKFALKIKKTMI
ncbi:MAG TPA: hypothetical protein ENK91_02460 [Bacteroidetes bacterium]|jgi:sigma-E factor negative regulatory protein RseC|nr:hypothetical protein [Bacteroidota bacterium]